MVSQEELEVSHRAHVPSAQPGVVQERYLRIVTAKRLGGIGARRGPYEQRVPCDLQASAGQCTAGSGARRSGQGVEYLPTEHPASSSGLERRLLGERVILSERRVQPVPRGLVDGGHVLTELPRGRRFELALRDLVEEGLVADLQDAGGFRAVPLDALEHVREGLPLGRLRPIPGDLSQTFRAERPRAQRERRSEEHTSELQSLRHLVCRLLLEKKKKKNIQVFKTAI